MKAKFYSVNRSRLNEVPIANGQIIATKDVSGFYYDMSDTRHHLQAADDVLYCLLDKQYTNSLGFAGIVDYNVTSGSLGASFDMRACPYERLEFVFYDNGTGTQFSSMLHGLPYGENGMYTYNWCNKAVASMPTDSTRIAGNGIIKRETVYATAVVSSDNTFKITGKTLISESVENGIITMIEHDISEDNRVALLKIVGRR